MFFKKLTHFSSVSLINELDNTTTNDVVIVSGGNFNFNLFLYIVELFFLASLMFSLLENIVALSSSKKVVSMEMVGNMVWAWWLIVLLASGVANWLMYLEVAVEAVV